MRIEEGIETAVESAKQIGMTKDEIIAIVVQYGSRIKKVQ